MISTVVEKRLQRATAARVLLSLHANGNLEDPARWTWDAVDRLPAWCLAGTEERVQLQLTCGVMYLSPAIRFWINKSALLVVKNLLGDTLFERIMSQADEMQLPRESVAEVIEQSGVEPTTAKGADIQNLLMAAGSTVLAATVHESLPRDMLTVSLGSGIGDITEDSAKVLLSAASILLREAASVQADAL